MSPLPDHPPFPRVIRIEPASQCNLACSHCPTGTVDMERGIMADATFKRIAEMVASNREQIKVIVLYHGGEPFLNKRFFDHVDTLRSISEAFFIKTVSNGTILTGNVVEKVLASSLDAIEFSLDGESPEESEAVRRKSSTGKITRNVLHLLNLKEKRGLLKPDVLISSTQFVRRERQVPPTGSPATPQWLVNTFGTRVQYKVNFALQWPHMGDTGSFDFLRAHSEDKNACDHVVSTATIRADGSVVACCYDLTSQLVMGNINDTSFVAIWQGEKYQSLRKSIADKNFRSICENCAVVRPPVYLVPKWRLPIPVVQA